MMSKVEKVVSELNNLMEKHGDYFEYAFGCKKEDLVSSYGFCCNESNPDEICYIERCSIIKSKYSVSRVEKMLSKALGNKDKEIDLIWKVMTELTKVYEVLATHYYKGTVVWVDEIKSFHNKKEALKYAKSVDLKKYISKHRPTDKIVLTLELYYPECDDERDEEILYEDEIQL